ncbi:MAG TPA: glycosyl hydrolase [Verrucomicrobiae bacterium]|nr:glycosyl hydrolase [Verrucomicrobiae bacterium]
MLKLTVPFAALGLALKLAGSAFAATIVLEAENGVLTGTSVTTAAPGYSGTGYVTGFDNTGDSVRWTFGASNGIYNLRIRFRSQYGQKGFDATLNGATATGMFPQSTTFAMFDAGLVELTNGNNTLQISGGWNYYEIDRADLVFTNAPPPPLPVPATLVDSNATFAARMLMADLVAAYGKITWSGQHETNEAVYVLNTSGRKPLIISGDLIDYSPTRVQYQGAPANYTERMIAEERLGQVQAMCWHWNAPTNLINQPGQEWWRGFYTEATTFDIAAALANTNSTEYAMVLRDMDAVAVQLKKFSSNNIPVLWRPLHESEGGWFWWGAKGPEPFKQLWRLLYQRLTSHHGLHNLIWVLTSENPAWYPGDDVVDVIGVDAYPTDKSDALSGQWQALLARFNGKKLLALTEFGGVPDIEKMQRFGVWWSWFAPWTGIYGPTAMPTETVNRIYQSPAVFTLDEANTVPPKFISITQAWNGQIQLAGTGRRGATNRVLATSNLNLPISSWSIISTGKFSGGVFTFSDSQTTNNPLRFYRVRTD